LAIVFGMIALTSPWATAAGLVVLFSAWAFIDGVFALAAAVRRARAGLRWGWFVFEGLVSLAAGAVAILFPAWTLLWLVIVVAVRAILLGGLMVGAAFSWNGIHSRWLQGITGAVSLVFGVLLLWRPLVGGLALIWTVGIYAIVFGIMSFTLGLRLHALPGPTFPPHARATAA
jgi:uncharacterized membrane protein HdeD (DUF308 family)